MTFLSANLAALQLWNPAAARLIEAAAIPDGWQPVRARDGTPTFSKSNADTIEWLGATSMPRETAAAMVTNLEPGEGNGLALGIGAGHEWQAFLARLSPSQMLFILESDPAVARMALTICDLAADVASGRIALLIEGPPHGASEQLLEFLRTHEGFDPPAVLHTLPTLLGPRRNVLLARGEQLVRQAVIERSRLTMEANTAVSALGGCQSKSALAFLLTPRHLFERTTTTLADSLESAGWNVRRILIDHFSSASALARLRAIQQASPSLLLSDLFRSQLAIPLPAECRVVTIVPPDPGFAFWLPDRLPPPQAIGRRDLILCHADAHRRLLLDAGYPATQVHMHATAISSATISSPPVAAAAPSLAVRHRVALVANIFPLDPERYGLTLPTHVDVWRAACAVLVDDAWRAQPESVDDILRRAQRRAGVTIEDPELLASLRRGVRHILLGSVPLLTIAQQLTAAKIELKLIGEGWETPGADWPMGWLTAPAVTVERWPTAAHHDAMWADVALALQVSPDASVHPLLLDASRHDVALVALQYTFDGRPGTLSTLLRAGENYVETTAPQAITTLRSLLRDAPKRTRLANAATAAIEKTGWENVKSILESET